MKAKINTHGANWFLCSVDEDGDYMELEDRCCPECAAPIETDGESAVLFEHPKKKDSNWFMKCQCTHCGCIYTLERTEKEITKGFKAWQKQYED